MVPPVTKSSLSNSERRLLELLQRLNFGKIQYLKVRGGVPVFHPAPYVVQTRKMGGSHGPREESNLQDFVLKQPVIELFSAIRALGDGEILTITVMHGLPHVVEHRLDEQGDRHE